MNQEEILSAIENMSVLELSELVKAIEEKFDVSAEAAPVAVAGGGAAAGGAEGGGEEQTEFDVVLTGEGEKKVNTIKVLRGVTGLGLKEAKEMVEQLPATIKEGVSKEEADDIKSQMEEAGAPVDIK
jgi:large subunit ribosomal protein L7/L12